MINEENTNKLIGQLQNEILKRISEIDRIREEIRDYEGIIDGLRELINGKEKE